MIEIKDLEKEFDVRCGACAEHIAEGGDQWPGIDGLPICRICWESECDDVWWQAMDYGR